MSVTKNIVESFRKVVQDLLVPELKAVKVSVDALHSEMGYLRTEVKGSIDALRTEMKLRDELHTQSLQSLSEKLDYSIEGFVSASPRLKPVCPGSRTKLATHLTMKYKFDNEYGLPRRATSLRGLRPDYSPSAKIAE